MLTVTLFRIAGVIGSPVEDRVPLGATCQFVCSDTQPDAESYCRDVLSPLGYQIEELLSQSELSEERLCDTDTQLFHNYMLLGYALRFFKGEEKG
jgi:hypothetical protein